MRPIQIHPLSALAGAVFGVLALLSMSLAPQLANNATTRVVVTKPVDVIPAQVPHPRDYVTIREGAPFVVPDGRILVLTALGKSSEQGLCTLQLDGVDECIASAQYAISTGSGAGGVGNGTTLKRLPDGFAVAAGVTVSVDGHEGSSGIRGRAWGYLVDA